MQRLLAALWDSLFDSTQSPVRYLSRALLIDLPISLPFAFLVGLALPTKSPEFPQVQPASLLLALCILSPLVETLLMLGLFFVLRFFVRKPANLVILSTLLWAGLHSLLAPVWGLGVFWPFLVFSICFLTWEKRSRTHALGMTASLHALHNLAPAILLVLAKR